MSILQKIFSLKKLLNKGKVKPIILMIDIFLLERKDGGWS